MRESLQFSFRLMSFIVVPAAAGILVLAVPITTVLFERGAFGHSQAVLTAQALAALAIGLWPVSLQRLVVPAFYAMQDTRTPVIAALAAFLANVLLSLMLMGPIDSGGGSTATEVIARVTDHLGWLDLRHVGLALATSLAAAVNLAVLLLLLRRRLGSLGLGKVLPAIGRDLLAAAVMAPVVWAVAASLDWSQPAALALRLGVLLAAVAAGAIVFAVVQQLMGARELRIVGEMLRRRLGRERPKVEG
jgi:putative peptidoglycan lipid II flippase